MRDNDNDLAIMPRKRKIEPSLSKMTIGIGLISRRGKRNQDMIVMASDSQMTMSDGRKSLTKEKVLTIDFINARILLVQSGMAEPAGLAVERIKSAASGFKIEGVESVERFFGNTMRQVRKDILGEEFPYDQKAQDYLFRDLRFDFLIGFYIGGKPYLYSADICKCSAWPVMEKDYAAIGCGDYLSLYLIKQFHAVDPLFSNPEQVAVSVIQKVKENVSNCDGKTQLGIVFPSLIDGGFECNADVCPDEFVRVMESAASETESELKKKTNELISGFSERLQSKFETAWKAVQNKQG